MATLKFTGNQSAFYTDLKARVQAYFDERKISMHGDYRNAIKTVVLLSTFLVLYFILAFHVIPGAWGLLVCVMLGLTTAGIGFNIMHDGSHGSLSSSPFINKLAALSLNMLGGSSMLWNIKHNIIHHSFTNIEDHDDDILNEPLFRLTTHQKKRKLHRFQYLYWPLAYGLMYIAWVFALDFKKYFRRQIAERKILRVTWQQHLGFWLTKLAYVFFYLIVPLYSYSWLSVVAGYLVFAFTTGLVTSVVFQLAHIVEGIDFVEPKKDDFVLKTDWATHQVKTTANFAAGNKIVTWFTGGLNHQVEHHLFPKISHVHYDALSKIVRNVCREYGLPYHEQASVLKAISSHIRFLYQLGH